MTLKNFPLPLIASAFLLHPIYASDLDFSDSSYTETSTSSWSGPNIETSSESEDTSGSNSLPESSSELKKSEVKNSLDPVFEDLGQLSPLFLEIMTHNRNKGHAQTEIQEATYREKKAEKWYLEKQEKLRKAEEELKKSEEYLKEKSQEKEKITEQNMAIIENAEKCLANLTDRDSLSPEEKIILAIDQQIGSIMDSGDPTNFLQRLMHPSGNLTNDDSNIMDPLIDIFTQAYNVGPNPPIETMYEKNPDALASMLTLYNTIKLTDIHLNGSTNGWASLEEPMRNIQNLLSKK